ncbi:MAG: hypothetical protein V1909_00010 [Candidatus Micrarchaeota archaeon]
MICERCSNETHRPEKCTYCSRIMCSDCEKSSKNSKLEGRLVICKTCWGAMKKRQKFKTSK